jgi:hypothetical protein
MKALLILLISFSAMADGQRVYTFGDLMVAFEEVDGLIVNRACEDKKCEAFIKGKKFGKKNLDPKLLEGGKNPSSVRCKTLMDGKVLIGADLEGNQQSVCAFKDGSFLI